MKTPKRPQDSAKEIEGFIVLAVATVLRAGARSGRLSLTASEIVEGAEDLLAIVKTRYNISFEELLSK